MRLLWKLAIVGTLTFVLSSYHRLRGLLPPPSSSLSPLRVKVMTVSTRPRRIEYKFRPGPHRSSPHDIHKCPLDKNRDPLPPELAHAIGNYTVDLSTDLKIVVMGDSIGIQLSQLLQHVAGSDDSTRVVHKTTVSKRDMVTLAPVRGGGTIAGFRIHNLLLRRAENETSGKRHGGWNRTELKALELTEYMYQNETKMVGKHDVLIVRIPQYWIGLEDVSQGSLQETIEVASDVLGVSMVVFLTLPVCTNYFLLEDIAEMRRVNGFVRDFVDNWNQTNTRAMVLEIGELINAAGEINARLLGYDTSSDEYLLERVPEKWRSIERIASITCSRPIQDNSSCVNSRIYKDGMHWCMETFGPRIAAGIACLIQCNSFGATNHMIRECDHHCNDQFMRLNGKNMTYGKTW